MEIIFPNMKQSIAKLCTRAAVLLLVLSSSFSTATAENYPYRSDYLWLTVPNHSDWIYKTGEKAKVEVTFCKYGIPQNTEISYEIGQECCRHLRPER